MPDGGGFVVHAQDVPEAAPARAAEANGFDGLRKGRSARRVVRQEWLVEFAATGERSLFERKTAERGDFGVGHLSKAADGAAGFGGGAGEGLAQYRIRDAEFVARAVVPIDGATVFDDERSRDGELELPPFGLGARFASAEHQRNVTPAEPVEGGTRGREIVGVVIEQCPVEVGDHHESHPWPWCSGIAAEARG